LENKNQIRILRRVYFSKTPQNNIMEHNASHIELQLEEYLCYLYLCMASADMFVLDAELDTIKNAVRNVLSRHFPNSKADVGAIVNRLVETNVMETETQKQEKLKVNSKNHPLPFAAKMQIMDDMNVLMHSDKNLSPGEIAMFAYIRECLMEK
jgi:hypothetical protein